MGKAFVWETDPETAFVELGQEYVTAIHAGIFAIAQSYTPEIENWMKANAVWTDRTGNARQGLWSDAEQIVNQSVEVIFSHGVDYGKWLELIQAGKYAIIAPALDYFAPKMWADIVRLLR
jgi:hypothetical protein